MTKKLKLENEMLIEKLNITAILNIALFAVFTISFVISIIYMFL